MSLIAIAAFLICIETAVPLPKAGSHVKSPLDLL